MEYGGSCFHWRIAMIDVSVGLSIVIVLIWILGVSRLANSTLPPNGWDYAILGVLCILISTGIAHYMGGVWAWGAAGIIGLGTLIALFILWLKSRLNTLAETTSGDDW